MPSYSFRFILTKAIFLCFPFIVSGQQLDNSGDQKPFSIHGSLSANLIGYNVKGIESRMSPFSMMFAANANVSVYGLEMPFSFRFSDRQTEYSQPFNQFGISPTYKWLKTHFGYRNVSFSEYTLAGHTFLGGGVELTPGKFRFGAVYGRFRKRTTAFEQAIDTNQMPTRKGFAVKLGVGTQKTYIDLVFMKIKDDSTSVNSPSDQQLSPVEENVVSGLNTRIAFSEKVWFESELAASFYTTDLSAPGFDGIENIPVLDKLDNLFAINQSSELLTAVRTSINFKSKVFSSRLEYRRIDPGYRSMGAYFFNNDIENLVIAPSFSMLKRKLLIRGSVGLQRDNLRNSKKATSLRTISSLNLSYSPVQVFGIDINYNNYSSNQRAGRVPLIDSLKLYQATSNLSIAPRLMFFNSKHNHMVMLLYNRMNLNDKNETTQLFSENKATLVNLNYNLGFVEQSFSIIFGINYNKLENYFVENSASGFTLGASKMLFQSKLMLGLNNSIIFNKTDQGSSTIINSSFFSSYQLASKHAFRLSIFLIRSENPAEMLVPNFTEIKGDLGYVFTF